MSTVAQINASRAANVAAGRSAYSGAGATATNNPTGVSNPSVITNIPAAGVNTVSAPNTMGGAITASGQMIAPNTPITSSNTAPGTAVALPPAPVSSYSQGITTALVTGANTTNGGSGDSSVNPADKYGASATQPGSSGDFMQQILDNINNRPSPPSTASIYNSLPEKAARDAAQQNVNNYQAQLNGITAKQNTDLLSTRASLSANGGNEATYGGIQSTINREAAIAALPVAAQLAASQANLALAETHLDTLFKLEVADATAKYDYQTKQFDSIKGLLTTSEQRRYDAGLLTASRAYDTTKTNIAEKDAWSKLALASGQTSLISSFATIDPNQSAEAFQTEMGKVQSKLVRADKYTPVKDVFGNVIGGYDTVNGTFKSISGAPIPKTDLKDNTPLATNTINQTTPIITKDTNGNPMVAHPPTGNPIVDQAQQLVDGNAVPSTNRPTKLDYLVQAKANELSIAQTGKPYSAIDAAAAYKFRNSGTYQKFIANAPVAMSTINTIVADARKLNLQGSDALNSLQLKFMASGFDYFATQEERATAKELVNTLGSISADDIGLLLGSGSGSDYKTKLGGAIFDVAGNLQTTEQIAKTVNDRIQAKLNDYYRIAGVKDPSIYAARDASAITGSGGTSSDKYSAQRGQLKAGEVLVNRGGQVGAVPQAEVLPTDTKL